VEAYAELERRFARLMTLRSIEDVLQWDTSAMMPSGAADGRAHQLAFLRVMAHDMLSDPDFDELLGRAEADKSALDEWQFANLREMRRMWIHAAAVPGELVEAASRAASACEARWRTARPESDFEGIAPLLAEVVKRAREVGAARADRLGTTAYDALLDEHLPGMRAAGIDSLFDDLGGRLPSLRERALEAQAKRPAPLPLEGPFSIEAQRTLGIQLMRQVGFDFDRGRLDVSLHPFCGGTPDDIRITTRYDENDFATSLMGVLHETGHALYEAGLPQRWRHQPVGRARGMAMHESQSLLLEMQACRSRPFLEHIAPLVRKAFDRKGDAWTAENLYRHYARVSPSFIRVSADEICYPSHVILRYRLERALIGGELEVADLPAAWSEGMRELLGLEPPDHRHGCLQDVHWFDGVFGYFPAYTLGAVIAAQLYRSAVASHPEIPEAIAAGDFTHLLTFLRSHIHSRGAMLDPNELVMRATGDPIALDSYLAHLEERYLSDGA
jgi:carboxypeptidase Taq